MLQVKPSFGEGELQPTNTQNTPKPKPWTTFQNYDRKMNIIYGEGSKIVGHCATHKPLDENLYNEEEVEF